MEALAGFLLAGLALTGSPGPNTLSLAATGAAFGVRRGIAYMIGLVLGMIGVMAIVASGVAALLLATLFVFHPFWQSPQPLAEFPMHWALKDAALIGGLMAAAIADRLRQRLRTALELYAGVPPRQAGR